MNAGGPVHGVDPLGVVGTLIGGSFDVVEFIGAHGPRAVYRGHHRAWGEDVRLELLAPSGGGDAQRAEVQRRGFVRAGGTVAKLASASSTIVQPRHGGLLDTACGPAAFVASEWIDGLDLAASFVKVRENSTRSRYPAELVFDWLEPVFDALEGAHREGVVHGSLDLHALFVRGDLGPRSTFKLQGLVEAAWRASVRGGSLPLRAAAPDCAAPELATADTTMLGPWTDIYGLASIFTVLACGASDPASIEQHLPQTLRFAFGKARAVRIDERFKNLAAFRATLLEAFEGTVGEKSRNPRQTMVVSDVRDEVSEGSAGGFEVSAEEEVPREPVVSKGRARVRLAHTVPSMEVPESIRDVPSGANVVQRPPSNPYPVAPAPAPAPAPVQAKPAAARDAGPSGGVLAILIAALVLVAAAGMGIGYWLFGS